MVGNIWQSFAIFGNILQYLVIFGNIIKENLVGHILAGRKLSLVPKILIFIGPRYPWSDLWVQVSLTHTPFADLTDVTLADEDTNSILIDNANRSIQGNVAMQVTQPIGQLCKQCKLCHLVA